MLGILERISSVFLPIGVALYAVLYVSIQQIYEIFAVSPTQVGIDQSVLFGRLLLTVILVVVAAVPVLGVLVGIGWLLNALSRGWLGRGVQAVRRLPWVVALIAGLWCGATYWGLVQAFVDVEVVVVLVLAVVLGLLVFLVPFRLMRRKPIGKAGMKLVVLGFTGLGLGFLLLGSLIEAAVESHETGIVAPALILVGFQDQWAVLEDKESGDPLYDGRWMLLLGEHEGMTAVYDCERGETVRRPSESIVQTGLMFYLEREPGFACGGLAE